MGALPIRRVVELVLRAPATSEENIDESRWAETSEYVGW